MSLLAFWGWGRGWSALLLAGLATSAMACGGSAEAFTLPPAAPTAQAEARGALGLAPGEQMAFEVRLAGVAVGEAVLAVGEPGQLEGRSALTVRSKLSTTGAVRLLRPVDDESTTVIDAQSGAPLMLETHVLLGGQETFTKARFAQGQAVVEVRRAQDAAGRPYTVSFGDAPAHDAHSAMAELRTWRAAPGAKRTMWAVGGRRLWRVDLTYVGVESLGTAQGNRRATRLDGVGYRANPNRTLDERRPPRRFSVWFSDDADRVPLRIGAITELGDVRIDLTEYARP